MRTKFVFIVKQSSTFYIIHVYIYPLKREEKTKILLRMKKSSHCLACKFAPQLINTKNTYILYNGYRITKINGRVGKMLAVEWVYVILT